MNMCVIEWFASVRTDPPGLVSGLVSGLVPTTPQPPHLRYGMRAATHWLKATASKGSMPSKGVHAALGGQCLPLVFLPAILHPSRCCFCRLTPQQSLNQV
jgi:hypothetical protein